MPDKSCTICNKGKLSRKFMVAADIFTGEMFDILECDFCGVKRTDPVPNDLSRYYENEIGVLMRKNISGVYSFFKNILLNRELSKIVQRVGKREFLDVGCGAGDYAKIIHKKGYKTYAADSAQERPSFLIDSGVQYYKIDYETYEIHDFKGLNKGIVTLRHVLEHLRDPHSFFKRMLNYGAGGFYMLVPNIASLKVKLLGTYSAFLEPPRHIWHFDKKSLKIFIEGLGLEIVDFGYYTIPTFVPSLYRFLRLKNAPKWLYDYFNPKGTITTLSLPFDWLLPGDVIWLLAVRKD